jgi:hypothetical protein
MTNPGAISGFFTAAKKMLARHKILVLFGVTLAVVVLVNRVNLRGSLIGGPPGAGSSSSSEDSLRTCSDVGTMFEGMGNLAKVMEKYHGKVSEVVLERQKYLRDPQKWKCPGQNPGMPKLEALASQLPGWKYPDRSAGSSSSQNYLSRPVIFESFSSILGEYLREYDCKLVRLQQSSVNAVMTNNDVSSGCSPGVDCPDTAISDLAVRPGAYMSKIDSERHRARVALERTLNVLRSFEMNYSAAHDLICFHRAALDLRTEMSLLADTSSCLPKIWDALTSIHDRKPEP